MSALAGRLRAMRSQAGALPIPTPRSQGDSDAQRAALRRLLGIRERVGPVSPHRPLARDRRLDGVAFADGVVLREFLAEWPLPAAAEFAVDRFEPFRFEQALCFDTETTGLAGGTGTRAFMIGAADWQPGGLRIRQLTLTSMAGEVPMLREFASWLAPDTVLVSYNGRCFDAPLLATRYRLARLDNPLLGRAHLDLLHPVRRRYRGVWENCRLITVERQLLGVVREDDLPGAEAPRVWREYLKGGSARDLRRVGEHNAQDLRSLAGVLVSMGEAEAAGREVALEG